MGEKASQPIWHLSRDGKQYGPISDEELRRLIELGKLSRDDLLWRPGFADWRAASTVPGIFTPPGPPPAGAGTGFEWTEHRKPAEKDQTAHRPVEHNQRRSFWRRLRPDQKIRQPTVSLWALGHRPGMAGLLSRLGCSQSFGRSISP
jgi:hypothetical protein